MANYERFIAWQHAHGLTMAVYRATACFPSDERYGLTSQARRAAFSAAANIVEGSARKGSREFQHFLNIALGSLAELEYIIRLSRELGYLDAETGEALDAQCRTASKTTWGLMRSLTRAPPR